MMKSSRNKEADRIYRAYLKSDICTVFAAYRTRPSIYKEAAENSIIEEMKENKGFSYRVISHSGFVFTCGYLVEKNGDLFLVYHTKTRREEILIDGEYHYWQA